MRVIDKLFVVRTLLSLSQTEAAQEAGINQTSISLLERGEKKFIPTEYLQFLYNKGIDINWLFNENNNNAEIFRAGGAATVLPPVPPIPDDSLSSFIIKGMNKTNEAETKKIKHEYSFDMTPEFKEILQELKKLNQNLEKQSLTNS